MGPVVAGGPIYSGVSDWARLSSGLIVRIAFLWSSSHCKDMAAWFCLLFHTPLLTHMHDSGAQHAIRRDGSVDVEYLLRHWQHGILFLGKDTPAAHRWMFGCVNQVILCASYKAGQDCIKSSASEAALAVAMSPQLHQGRLHYNHPDTLYSLQGAATRTRTVAENQLGLTIYNSQARSASHMVHHRTPRSHQSTGLWQHCFAHDQSRV
jgi:hypothetical protein